MQPETLWAKFQGVMKEIWPTVYRIINGAIYFLIRVIQAIVKIAIQQVQNK